MNSFQDGLSLIKFFLARAAVLWRGKIFDLSNRGGAIRRRLRRYPLEFDVGDVAGCDCAVEAGGVEDEGDGLLAGREVGAGSLRTGSAAGLAGFCVWRSGKKLCSPASCRPRRMSVSPTFSTETQNERDENNGQSEANDSGKRRRGSNGGDSTRKSSAEERRAIAGGGTSSTRGG